MISNEKAPTATDSRSPTPLQNQSSVSSFNDFSNARKPEKKWRRVLRRLLNGPLDRFEAERYPVSDHCLNSTISELKKRDLIINSKLVHRSGFGGEGAYIAEYQLAQQSRGKAIELLGGGQ